MLAGIALSLLAAWLFAGGNAFEKRAVDQLPRLQRRGVRDFAKGVLTSPIWILGAALSVLGILAQVFAFARISIVVVQAIGIIGAVSLVAIGRMHFREHFTQGELAGILVGLVSLASLVLSLGGRSDVAGRHGKIGPIVVVLVLTLLVVGALALASSRRGDREGGFLIGTAAGLCYGLEGIGAKGLSTLGFKLNHWSVIQHDLATVYPYIFIGAWAIGLVLFQVGIQRHRLGLVGPVASVASSAYVVALGTPLFGEHLPSDPLRLGLRIAGFVGIVVASTMIGLTGGQGTEAGVATSLPDAIGNSH